MQFVNNWLRPITLAASEASASIDLPDGQYILTLADSETSATRWEVVTADVVGGAAVLQRGQDGTDDSSWESGSVIYCTMTAGILQTLFSRIDSLESRVGELEAIAAGRLTIEIVSEVVPFDQTLSGWLDGAAGSLVSAPTELGGVAVSFSATAVQLSDGLIAIMIQGTASADIAGLAFTLDAPGFAGVSVTVEQAPGEAAFGIMAAPVAGQLWPDGPVTVTLTPS